MGSTQYVDSLTDNELSTIMANLNFDMLASPNYVRFVYDGDGSDTPVAGPPGSAEIERVFAAHLARQKLATDPTAFDRRSEYGPFIAVGIPAGGLFSGAEGIKTPAQAATYGGVAGDPYDGGVRRDPARVSSPTRRGPPHRPHGAGPARMARAWSPSATSLCNRIRSTPPQVRSARPRLA